ncbi:helix-turn-helix transcriptional regulator [Flavobacterium sp. J27]|uniref:helix-turn-helix domain-containing protein n=1 Tax=Flavobacterium sp. J27 TaxID=2060419 RepID=UPI001031073D|nr:helix-turn-helix transcriptional regulator [Flavobacterium sp. J27]
MKKRNIFKTPLLFSQEEMALLLGVTRSTWSMYVSGLRDIPTEAILKLAKLLKSENQLPLVTLELTHRSIQENKKRKMLAEELAKNKREEVLLQKKLEKTQKKYQEAEHTLRFLMLHKNNKDLSEQEVLIMQNVKNRALQQVEKNGLHVQAKYEVQLNALKMYVKQLENARK